MRSKSAPVDTDRVVLTEARPARANKYLELDASDASADEADDARDLDWPTSLTGAWMASAASSPSPNNNNHKSPSPKSPPSPAAPASPQGASPPTSSSWKDKMVRRRHDSGSSKNGKKDKNEPSRFMGEGVSFKAKLIGILEVAEARGDRMCQDALADLKMAIRAAGEHKQRITINIAIDGLRLRDEKTGDCLYHHLVHKISFIAQDMTDPRAFGYIFGSPDTGHRFFGIKTDKAASQVVECIRDLFQVVFALKNREQHIEQQHMKICGGSTSSLMSSTTTTPSVTYMEAMAHHLKESCVRENGSPGAVASSSKAESEATIADLLDLEYELNNLQQNIHQMDQITAAAAKQEDAFEHDPFGDSFTATTTKTTTTKTSSAGSTAVAALPPPPSAKDGARPDGTGTHRRERTVNRAGSTTSTTTATVSAASTAFTSTAATFGAAAAPPSAPLAQEEKHWFDQETEALFDDGEMPGTMSKTNQLDQDSNRASPLEMSRQANLLADQFDVFTELDPLGTGRSKPYVDKKDFFSDLKNPPKKVLKDLVGEVDPLSAPAPAPLFQASFDSGSRDLTGSQAGALGDVLSALESAPGSSTSFPAFPDPFSDDPFDKTDPFAEGSFSQTVSFSPNTVMADPFETGFADFSSFPPGSRNSASPLPSAGGASGGGTLHGPLRVSLPPEDGSASSGTASCLSPSPPLSGSGPATSSLSRQRNRFARKQLSVSMVKIPSPKSSQRRSRLPKQMTVDGSGQGVRFPPLGSSPTPADEAAQLQRRSPGGLSRGGITPSPPIVASFPDLDGDAGSRLSGSSAELAEIAPEPPPRPTPNAFSIKPPPLPPKKHTGTIFKPPPRPPHQDDHSIYDHIENYESSSSPTPHDASDAKSPPIPVPARKPRYSEENSVPLRPKKQNIAETEDGYLAPIPFLPPPVKRHHSSSNSQSQQRRSAQPAPGPTKKSLDITLSQLTKTGFSDLAGTLGISPSQLSKMTLQDLTKRLASLSDAPQTDAFTAGNRGSLSKAEYTALRESVDEDSGFAAEFDDNFCNMGGVGLAGASSVPNQESLYDKYAVFRELLLQDEPSGRSSSQEQADTVSLTESKEENSEQGEAAGEVSARTSSVPHSSPITINVVGHSDSNSNAVSSASPSPALVDRYAALREISLCDESSNKDDDERDEDREDNNGYAEVENDLSDKEDSITEVNHEAMEDQDLLTLSAQHSESTESPTLDTNTVRDAPSIMETTILEEDACGSEGDSAEQPVPPKQPSLLDSSIVSLEPVPENLELTTKSLISNLMNGSVPAETAAAQAATSETTSRPQSLEASEAWAKFDSSQFEKPVSDDGASPWSSDGKEFSNKVPGWKDDSDHERRDRDRDKGRRRRGRGPAAGTAWPEDEESEEGWDDRVSDDPWENGYDEGQRGRYPEPRRSRRRKVSPWRRGAAGSVGKQSSREVSPWESGDSTGPPPGPADRPPSDRSQDDMKRSWKTRPKNRGSSWEEERAQRLPGGLGGGGGPGPGSTRGSWDGESSEYDDARKRRQSPWGEDRDRDRWHAWEEDEYYRREGGWDWYYRDREHRDRDHREDEYRRRWEYERSRDRDRDREWEWDRYGRPRKSGPGGPPSSHYRDWDDETSEQGDDEHPHGPHGPHPTHGAHGAHGVRKWRRSRPGSAASRGHDRVSPSTSVEYKEDDSPSSAAAAHAAAHAGRRRVYRDHDRDWERDRVGGSMDRRSRSREDPFSSDQEHEYWERGEPRPEPRGEPRGERTRSRTERDARYEQRSQTLYARRTNRSRYKTFDPPKQSPFEDDFSSQRFDFVTEPKQSSASFSQESSLDTSEPTRSPQPSAGLAHFHGHGPKVHVAPRKRDSLSESEEARGVEAGGLGASLSPLERGGGGGGGGSGRGRASSMGSSRRQSPFEDDFTPPNSASGVRHLSSASSDISDQHRLTADEGAQAGSKPGSRAGSRPGSGRRPTLGSSGAGPSAPAAPVASSGPDADSRSNGRSMDDVFLPPEACPPDPSALPHPDSAEPVISPNRPSAEHRRSVRISGEDKNLAGMKARLANLRRTDSSSSLRKSESINIFARSCDPFDDDDFFAEDGSPAVQPPHGGKAEHSAGHRSGDQFKWTEAFDSFNFEEEH